MDVRVKLRLLHLLGEVADWVGELGGGGQRQHALGAVTAWGHGGGGGGGGGQLSYDHLPLFSV